MQQQKSDIFSKFGQTNLSQPQQPPSLFGNIGQSVQGQQQSSLFGGLSSDQGNQSMQAGGGSFTGLRQSNQLPLQNVIDLGRTQSQSQPLLQLGRSGIWQPNSSIGPRCYFLP